MIVSTSTPGKLILLGEYAVLEGAPAIVTAVNKFAKISVEESSDFQFVFNAPNLNLLDLCFEVEKDNSIQFKDELNDVQKNKLNLFINIFKSIIEFIQSRNIEVKPSRITIDTSDFYFENSNNKLGLGSSAALTVGLIKSMLKYNNILLTNIDELFQFALRSHFEAQEKTGSGIDIAASIFGGIGVFKKTNDTHSFKNIDLPEDLIIIPFWTGSSTSTPEFISKTKQLKITNPEIYNKIINRLTTISNNGCESLSVNNTIKFLTFVDQYYDSMDELGNKSGIPIISDSHIAIRNIVKASGGFYKPSGAGGSDIGIAFTNDVNIKENIINKINESQFKYIKFE